MSDEHTRRGKAPGITAMREAARVMEQTEIIPALVVEQDETYPKQETRVLERGPGRLVLEISDGDLTDDQLAQLAQAEARTVDTTDPDAPELPAEAWAAGLAARRRRLERPRKEAISIRLDVDVLAWFRRQGPGYQREINRLLRERMDTMGGH